MTELKWPENNPKRGTDSPAKTDKTSVKSIIIGSFVSNISFVSDGLRHKFLLKTDIIENSITHRRILAQGFEVLNARNT